MYNYLESMKSDVRDYIADNVDFNEYREDRDGLEQSLHDDLWIVDSVTGNASGSYTFNRNEAKDYVLDNMDICIESITEFCTPAEIIAQRFLEQDWEYFDVTIRCYLLGQVINEVLDEAEEAGAFDPIEEEEIEEEEIEEQETAIA